MDTPPLTDRTCSMKKGLDSLARRGGQAGQCRVGGGCAGRGGVRAAAAGVRMCQTPPWALSASEETRTVAGGQCVLAGWAWRKQAEWGGHSGKWGCLLGQAWATSICSTCFLSPGVWALQGSPCLRGTDTDRSVGTWGWHGHEGVHGGASDNVNLRGGENHNVGVSGLRGGGEVTSVSFVYRAVLESTELSLCPEEPICAPLPGGDLGGSLFQFMGCPKELAVTWFKGVRVPSLTWSPEHYRDRPPSMEPGVNPEHRPPKPERVC